MSAPKTIMGQWLGYYRRIGEDSLLLLFPAAHWIAYAVYIIWHFRRSLHTTGFVSSRKRARNITMNQGLSGQDLPDRGLPHSSSWPWTIKITLTLNDHKTHGPPLTACCSRCLAVSAKFSVQQAAAHHELDVRFSAKTDSSRPLRLLRLCLPALRWPPSPIELPSPN